MTDSATTATPDHTAIGSRVTLEAEVVAVFYPDPRWREIAITPGPGITPARVWVHLETLQGARA